MQPEKDLKDLFTVCGEDAVFASGTLRVFLNFDLYTVVPTTSGFGGMQSIEASYTMLAITADCKTLGLTDNMNFSVTDDTYDYTFTALRAMPDSTGVSSISVAFRGKEYV